MKPCSWFYCIFHWVNDVWIPERNNLKEIDGQFLSALSQERRVDVSAGVAARRDGRGSQLRLQGYMHYVLREARGSHWLNYK